MKPLVAALAALLALAAPSVPAQSYPAKPVRLIVPDGAGSISDVRARQVGAKLTDSLGQPVIIENKPGGSMMIGAEAAARSAPDGYTLFFGNVVTHSINPYTQKTITYRPDEDFTPVTMISSGPLVLVVNPSLPAKSLEDLIALAKTQPGKLSYGAVGYGSAAHIVMEQVKAARGTQLEFVPYKSSAQYIQELIGGQLQVSLNFWPVLGPHVKAGKLRALAVAGPRRLDAAPDVPTFAEAGLPGIEGHAWQGIMVPAGTPRAIVDRLQVEIARALTDPAIRATIVDLGSEIGGNSPEEFAAFIRADRARWKKAVADSGIEPK